MTPQADHRPAHCEGGGESSSEGNYISALAELSE